MNASWIVARTQPRKEDWAALNVERQGFAFYLPKFRCDRTGKIQIVFRSYLFVAIDGPWRWLRSTFGISHVLMDGDRPAVLPQRQYEDLKRREKFFKDGSSLIEMDRGTQFFKGQWVRITSGPLAWQFGLHQGVSNGDRECILMDILGQRTPVHVRSEFLEVA